MQKNIKKWIQLIAVTLAVIMLAGCNLIAIDEELNAKMTVLEVGGKPVTKAELYNAWNTAMDQTINFYRWYYGSELDSNDPDLREAMLEQAIDDIVTERVVQQQGKALGLDQFTEEELAELEPQVQSDWDYNASIVRQQFFAASDLEEEALTEAVNAKMAELEITWESVLDGVKAEKISERVREYAIADASVTAEEVAEEYQGLVGDQKAAYTETPAAYASDMTNGRTIYYVPDGYRYVKHVLLKIDSEASERIYTLQTELQTAQSNLETAQAALSDLEPGTSEEAGEEEAGEPAPTSEPLTEEEAAARTETIAALHGQIAELDETIAAKQAELELVQADAFGFLLPQVEELQSKIGLGLNFDKIVETYGEDTGMFTEPFKTMGYPVMEGLQVYDQAFQDAAMALGQVGDVSEPVQTSFGFHIIKYVGDSQEHEIGLDAVRDEMTDSLLTNRQNEAYRQAQDEWIKNTKIRRFDNRMDFM